MDLIRDSYKRKIKTKRVDGDVILGDKYGIDAEAHKEACEKMRDTILSAIYMNGEEVSVAVKKGVADIVSDAVFCVISNITEKQQASEESLKEAAQINFEKLQNGQKEFSERLIKEINEQRQKTDNIESAILKLTEIYGYKSESALQIFNDAINNINAYTTRELDKRQEEYISKLRTNLREAVNRENGNNDDIKKICSAIKEYVPNDFEANFYWTAVTGSVAEINAILPSVNPDADYVEDIINFLLNPIDPDCALQINYLIEKAFKRSGCIDCRYENYMTKLEDNKRLADLGVYDETLPRDVFLAYRSTDMDRVIELCNFLESNDITCFVSQRNLKHGRGAENLYDERLQRAIDSCTVLVFVSSQSSRTTGDARRKELTYIRQKDIKFAPAGHTLNYTRIPKRYKMPRVEYLIEPRNGMPNERFVAEFFDGYQWRESCEAVYEAVLQYLDGTDIDEFDTASDKEYGVKYCKNCGEKNLLNAEICSKKGCGCEEFVDSYAQFQRIKNKRELELKLKEKQDEQHRIEEITRRKLNEEIEKARKEFEKQLEAERKAREEAEQKLKETQRKSEALQKETEHKPPSTKFNKNPEIKDKLNTTDKITQTKPLPKSKWEESIPPLGAALKRVEFQVPASERAFYGKSEKELKELGYSITVDDCINNFQFEGQENLLNVVIGKGVTSIGDNAFFGCKRLLRVFIPDTVTSVGKNAFAYCSNFLEIYCEAQKKPENWDDSWNLDGNRVLWGFNGKNAEWEIPSKKKPASVASDSNLNDYEIVGSLLKSYSGKDETLVIPNCITRIGYYAVSAKESLKSVIFPLGITFISDEAFFACSNLESITLSESLQHIGSGAFAECNSLKRINYEGTVTSWNKIHKSRGWDRDIESYTIICSDGAIKRSYGKNVDDTMTGQVNNNSVVAGTTNVKSKRNKEFEIKDGVLIKYTGNSNSVFVPKGILSIGDEAFKDCQNVVYIGIFEGVVSIGNRVFQNCYRVKEIAIPHSVNTIGYTTEGNSRWLKKMVMAVGDFAFQNCYSLTKIKIPEVIKAIGIKAFEKCSSLTEIIIPESVTTIKEGAFSGCKSLTHIIIPEGVSSIGDGAFEGCEKLTINCKTTKPIFGLPSGWSKNWLGESKVKPKVIWGK